MKTPVLRLCLEAIVAAATLSLAGCSNPASGLLDADAPGSVRAGGAAFAASVSGKADAAVVFAVAPSGDLSGQSDWRSIMAAFQAAAAAGPGCVVELAAGDFYIDRPIAAKDFIGTFRGSGRRETRIHNPPRPGFVFPLLRAEGPAILDGYPTTMAFWQESASEERPYRVFADFSLYIDCSTEAWNSHGFEGRNNRNFIDNFGRCTGLEDFEVSKLDLTFERVDLVGERDPARYKADGYSALNTIQVGGEPVGENDGQGTLVFKYAKPVSGTFTISDCSIAHAAAGVDFVELRDSKVLVGGGPDRKFVAEDIGTPAVVLEDFSASSADISHLETLGCSGLLVFQADTAVFGIDMGPVPELMPEPSTYALSHADIHMAAGSQWAGCELYDFANMPSAWGGAGKDSVDLSIEDVSINSPGGGYPPVLGEFLDGVGVTGSRMTGQGDVAVAVDTFGAGGKRWKLVGNNLAGFDAAWGAPVYLGAGTSRCLVVGSGSDAVIDEGVDNVVTGMGRLAAKGLGGLLDMDDLRSRMGTLGR